MIFALSLANAFLADFNSSLSFSLYAINIHQTLSKGIVYSRSVGKYAVALDVTISKLSL